MLQTIQLTSGTVKFRLKEPNSKKETSIILDYSFGRGNRLKYSTGYKTFTRNWDIKNQRIRSVSSINNREEINNRLKEIELGFVKAISNLNEGQKYDKSVLKGLLDKIIRLEVKLEVNGLNFFQFADLYIKKREGRMKSVKSASLSPITLRAYKQTINKLKEFDRTSKYNLNFHNIDITFYYEFISFLERKEYSLNTIGKHIKNLITILNRATEEGVNTNLVYKQREFKTISESTTSIYLTNEEINQMYNLDLSQNSDLERARDIFIIGYFTCQRVSDYNGLTKQQIKKFDGQEVFEIYQKKTKKVVYIPIHSRISKIMKERYDGGFPKKLSDQKLNEYIKLIGKKAKIKEAIVCKRTVGGIIKEQSVLKYKLIGTHTARRSFCTNAYLSKMPVIDIMSLSGHTTEREFYKYIKVTPQERAVKIADSAFFNN